MNNNTKQMKWWGWGDEQIDFDIDSKPDLWPYIKKVVGIENDNKVVYTPPVPFEQINLPHQIINETFLNSVKNILNADQINLDKLDRLIHCYGKSFRDLWRIRHGIVKGAPDIILYPDNETQICEIITLANETGVKIIPFGGGSNIAGSLEVLKQQDACVVSLDLKRMDKVLSIDKESCVAKIQAGALGPYMEEQLQKEGFTLGHFPDSFEYSTLGGWVATRSAGMQSDIYGKIEDMVISLRMVTPNGTIATRTVPKSSNGIDIKHICIGSEGILGVITEASMQVHRLPKNRAAYGFLFPDFESGIKAVYECVEKNCMPVVTRLNDPDKTALSLAYKTKSSALKHHLGNLVKSYLKNVKGFDLEKCCLMLNVFEGDDEQFHSVKQKVKSIYKKYGAVNLGTDPGKAFEKGKYDFPYLRDFVMDRNIMADVSETATVWSNLLPLYYSTYTALETAIKKTGKKPFLGCHISHTYHTGASLYFTFGCTQIPGKEIEQYLYIKKAAEDAFIKGGATLSHHHAVGFEHLPWLEDDISKTGVDVLKALKKGLDPEGIMNPGKVIPVDQSITEWGLKSEDIANFDKGLS
ncbi:MAG: FAD-binding oxidoreductase [Ignavibacteriales bacterium]|nr:MAG: FAD-binding oxidoreductase [Ignavibacteriales bacterium]